MKNEHAFNEPAFDGAMVEMWLKKAAEKLAQNRATINYFNHFPVADSDTGTNMLATLEAALEAIDELHGSRDLQSVTAAAARGALLGARGNSGVILSQMLQSLAHSCQERTRLREVDLVDAFGAMAVGARQAVAEPVDGTILTALDQIVPSVVAFLPQLVGEALPPAAGGAAARAELSEPRRTPTLGLIVLTATMAVADSIFAVEEGPTPFPDAGTIGLGVILAALAELFGADPVYPEIFQRMLTDMPEQWDNQESPAACDEFEVMYLLDASAATAQAVRERLAQIGNSVAVTGAEDEIGGGLWQVHVHTKYPLAALTAPAQERGDLGLFAGTPAQFELFGGLARRGAARFADMRHVCVRYLQPAPWLATAEDPIMPLPANSGVRMLERRGVKPEWHGAPTSGELGLVAVTRSPGLVEQLARTGAVVVLLTGDSPVRARGAIDRAALETGAPVVAVLPCDQAAADAAQALATSYAHGRLHRRDARLYVAPSRNELEMLTVTLGHACPLPSGLDTQGAIAELTARSRSAMSRVRTAHLTGHVEEPALVESLRELLRYEPEVLTFLVSGESERALVDQMAERLLDLTDRALYSGSLNRTDAQGREQLPQTTFADLDVVVLDAGTEVPQILVAAE
ncbi:MAG: DAK2 domain-containing protein [Buchananella hordeovulneris]|nr:DAK2 domain-containing protein [Buchananella hordeovulneris]